MNEKSRIAMPAPAIEESRGRRISAAVLLAMLVLSPMAMLYPLWGNPVSAGEDDVVFYYPLRKLTGEALRGAVCGSEQAREKLVSLMADPQAAVMYPPTWLFAAMPSRPAYAISIFAAFAVMGAGTYLYIRKLGMIRPAAFFAATAMMYCGFMIGHRVHLSVIHAAAYLPWGLWCIETLREKPLKAFSAMVPTAFLALSAGHWPTFVHLTLIWIVYLLFRGRPLARSFGVAAGAMVLAVAMAAPQIQLTFELLQQATRNRIGFAMAGENSFFPPAAVLSLFPLIMGSRTPGFYPQAWWGPWHLCEMLGYVGLSTLVLAAGALRRLFRRPAGDAAATEPPGAAAMRGAVRTWGWMLLGAGVFMLGYYLPTYRLIHMLPVLGIVRAPARMVLAADMALATLAAAAIHAMAQPAGATALARLNQTLRRMAHFALPGAMAAVILMLGVLGAATYCRYRFQIPFFTGGAKDIFDVLRLQNPAVWVPIATMVATVVAIRVWLVRPASCAGVLTIVLLADLFMVARFVDIPPGGAAVANPDDSPAAQWLRQNDSDTAAYRVYGLSDSYFLRATELLLPKTAQAMGFVPLADYGPFQSPAHAELLGFRIFGTNRDWERLVRRNYLLSLYGVKYLIAEDPKFRRVIESVRMPSASRPADGPNLLAGPWQDERPDAQGVFHLQTAFLWRTAMARQDVKLTPGRVYRIALDARGPDGGAANFLKAQLVREFDVGRPEVSDDWALVVFDEHIGADWRHFEWVLQSPEYSADRESFQLHTSSERPIEVRNVSLRESSLDEPVEFSGTLAPGEAVYELRKELPAVNPNLPPVAVYENHLWRKQSAQPQPAKGVSGDIEMLKWRPDEYVKLSYPIPEIGFTLNSSPGYVALITTVPAVCIWLIALGVCWFATRRG